MFNNDMERMQEIIDYWIKRSNDFESELSRIKEGYKKLKTYRNRGGYLKQDLDNLIENKNRKGIKI